MKMDWVNWAMENAALGVPEDTLISIMQNSGMDLTAAISIASNAKTLPGFNVISKLTMQIKKLESVMQNAQLLLEQDPTYVKVPKIIAPNKDQFLQKYWALGKPAVLLGIADDWPALGKWTIEYFRDTYGSQIIQIQTGRDADADYEINSVSHRSPSTMKDFTEKILAVDSSNDFYMTANNHAVMKMPGILEDIGTLPEFINRPTANGMWHLWVGPKGTLTPFHHDQNALIHVQLLGRKKWQLISPLNTPDVYNHHYVFSKVNLFNIDFEKFPKMKQVKILEVIIEPGDALFLPVGWWHTVESLDRSISMSITDVVYDNTWKYNNPERELI